MLMVVQTMDRYAQKTSKTLMVVQTMDRYEHCAGQTRRLRSGSSAPALLSRRAEGPRMDVAGVEAPGRS